VCAWATIELCSNCTKLRISVGDELGDLQYNCTVFSLPTFLLPVYAAMAERITTPFNIYVHTPGSRVYMYLQCAVMCKRVCMYTLTCERTQTSTVTTLRSVGNTYPGAIFTQANRAVIPRAYPSSPSHTSTRIPLSKSRRKSYIASWSNARCRKWNGIRHQKYQNRHGWLMQHRHE